MHLVVARSASLIAIVLLAFLVHEYNKSEFAFESLFHKNTGDAKSTLSTGEKVSSPFIAYDSKVAVVHGVVSLDLLRSLVDDKELLPVKITPRGEYDKALLVIYCFNYLNSTLGSFSQVVVTTAVRQKGSNTKIDLSNSPLNILYAIFHHPSIHTFYLKQFSSTPLAAQFSREILSSNSKQSPIDFHFSFNGMNLVKHPSGAGLNDSIEMQYNFKGSLIDNVKTAWLMFRSIPLRSFSSFISSNYQVFYGFQPKKVWNKDYNPFVQLVIDTSTPFNCYFAKSDDTARFGRDVLGQELDFQAQFITYRSKLKLILMPPFHQ